MIQLLRHKPALLLCGLLAFLQFFVLGGAFGQTVIKSVSPTGGVYPGTTLTYTIAVSNSSGARYNNVNLTDTIPTGTTYVAGSTTLNGNAVSDDGSANNNGGTTIFPYDNTSGRTEIHDSNTNTNGRINNNQTATVVFQVTVDSATTASVTNSATTRRDPASTSVTSNTVTTPINGRLTGNLYRENTANSVYDPLQTSNANGAFDTPIGSGKTITITGPGGPFTATADVNGFYTIDLAAGTYTVTGPATTDGGSPQSPVSGSASVTITSSTTTTRNFGYGQPADTYNIPVDGSSSENAQQCAIPGKDGITASGIVNTYYTPLSNGSVAANSTTLSLNIAGARGAGVTLAVGDLLLVMQMQGASFNITDTNLYGDGGGPDASPYNDNRAPARGYTGTPIAGTYEYITVLSVSGNTVTLAAGLKNAYNQSDATASNGRQSYQVIRVPQYASLTIDRAAPLYPVSWNGFTGGVFAIDVAGTVTFTGAGTTPHIDASGRGFRGGGAVVRLDQIPGSVTYRGTNNTGAGNVGATKGEGIAGTPKDLRTARADTPVVENIANVTVTSSLVATGTTDGYPNGDLGRGAPGNAGGGGNQHNSAGGGGGNGGIGGFGGVTFNGDGGRDVGGFGGGVVALNARKIVLGGGGGAGELNNGTPPRATGGTGGGIIMLRVQTVSGGGLLQSDGSQGLGTRAADTEPGDAETSRDAAGGGGAGGSVLVIASTGHGNISVNARGGRGGNTNRPDAAEYEGAGGGGGGGVVLSNASVGTTTLTAGIAGLSFSSSFGGTGVKMGATDGQNGQTLTFSNTVPAVVYAGYNCLPTLTVTKNNEPSNSLVNKTQGIANTNQYKITISNSSGGSAQSVQVTDILPTGFTLAGSPTPTAVLAGGASGTLVTTGTTTLVFSGFTIPNGGSVTITYTVNIAASVAIGTYSNPAQVEFLDPTRTSAGRLVKPSTNNDGSGNTSFQGGGTVPGSNYNTALTNEDVRLNPPAQGFKSVKLNNALGPPALTWTIWYSNTSSSAISNFQITDTLPTVYVFATGSQTVSVSGGGTSAAINASYAGTGDLLAAGAVLGVGGTIRVDIPVTVNSVLPATLQNQSTGVYTANSINYTTLSDNIDNTTTGLPSGVTVPAGSVAQTQTAALDPTSVSFTAPTLPTWSCDSQLYQARVNPTNSSLFRINNINYSQTLIADYNKGINALGYNPTDNYMYAIDVNVGSSGNTLNKIGSDGTIQVLGTVTGLPTTPTWQGGTFDTAGNYYVINYDFVTPTGGVSQIYRINVSTRVATQIYSGTGFLTNIGDFVFNPIDGAIYGLLAQAATVANTVYKIALVGSPPSSVTITSAAIVGNPAFVAGTPAFGTVFVDGVGNLYGYDNNGAYYIFNLSTFGSGTVNAGQVVTGIQATTTSDGASCPYINPTRNIDVLKRLDSVLAVAPNSSRTFDVTYSIKIVNTNTISTANNVQINDDLRRTFPFTINPSPTISVTSPPSSIAGSCTINNSFNGTTDTKLLSGSNSLTAGQSCTVQFTARITYATNAEVPGTTLNNSAYGSASIGSSNPGISFASDGQVVPPPQVQAIDTSTNSATLATPGSPNGDIASPTPLRLVPIRGFKSVKITNDSAPLSVVNPGDTLTWSIWYTNEGSNTISNFQITDTLPANLNFTTGSQTVTVTGAGSSASPNASYAGTGNLLAASAVLAPAGTIRVDIPVIVQLAASNTTLSNQSSGSGTGIGAAILSDNVDNTTTGLPSGVTVPAGSVAQTQAASIDPTTAAVPAYNLISGYVYRDSNGNALYENGSSNQMAETVKSGVLVTITNGTNTFTINSNASGYYEFVSIPAGTYTLSVPGSSGGDTTSAPATGQYTGLAVANASVITRDFGYQRPVTDSYTPPTGIATNGIGAFCAIPGRDGPAAASGVVNSYYAGSGNLTIGATTITLGSLRAAPASQTAIAAGDLILVMQMQGTSFNSSNTNLYGDNVGPDDGDGNADKTNNNVGAQLTDPDAYGDNRRPARGFTGTPTAGTYEYAVVASVSGPTITLASGLQNAYIQDTSATRKTYQVLRVPQYSSLSINSASPVVAATWDGTTGGVVALDVYGAVSVTGAGTHIDVAGSGFRGGLTENGGADLGEMTYTTSNINRGGSKGEGIAGTPSNLGGAGYTGGDKSRGAPGNAGGGGSSHNSSGGGGGNGGRGGNAGRTWTSGGVSGDQARDVGGFGGGAVGIDPTRAVMGGGGGAGDINNGNPASGGNGGGIIMLRAKSVSGSANLRANGSQGAEDTVISSHSNDSAGGGGAGGSIIVALGSGHSNVTALAVGGRGGNSNSSTEAEYEGPGGGGGGGVVLSNGVALGSSSVVGGNQGTSGSTTTAYQDAGGSPNLDGAENGLVGQSLTTLGSLGMYQCAAPTLTVAKANNPTPGLVSYTQGVANTNQYKITIGNSGSTAQNVQVVDVLPTGFTLAGSPAPAAVLAGGATGTLTTSGSSTVTFSGFTIPSGGSVTITYTVDIANSVAVGTYSNPAQVLFLDPTRVTPGRLVKPSSNNDGSGNTSFEGGGTVPGSNYNTALTNEDVQLTAPATTAQISGFVYGDSNHDAIKNGAETGSLSDFTGLFVKLVPSAGGNAIAAVAVDPATGAYSLTGVAIGSYNLVLDNNNTLTDTTSSKPVNYLGTEAPSQTILTVSVVSNSDNITNQNFGLYKGSRVTGRVWRDDGNGFTLANDGRQLGTEPGLGNFTVSVLSGVSVVDTSVTVGNGDYVLYVPFGTANPLIQVTKPSGWTATGTNIADANVCLVANSSGASQRFVGDTTCAGAASFVSGIVYNDYNFGLVPPIALAANSTQSAGTPSSVSYPHNFTPGTLGNVSFSVTGTQPGFGYALYLDTNNNSVVDGADQSLSSPLTVDNTWPRNPDGTLATRRVILVVNIPSGVATGTVDMATIVASQSFTNNPPVLRSASVLDTTTITGSNGNNGILRLMKSSRNCGNITDLAVCSGAYSLNIIQAKPGEVVEYKIEYSNIGSGSISNVIVFDNPPYFSDVIAGFQFWTRPNGSAGNVGNISLSISTGLKLELNKPSFDLINPLLPGEAGYVLYRVRVR
jgi:uncharacterized repeat protein (TIGR01451 family)